MQGAAVRARQDLGAFPEGTRAAIRDVLRVGGYKPSGRGKPASEFLHGAACEGGLPVVNNLVDINNLVSLTTALPISMFDADRLGVPAVVRFGRVGERYVFNVSGQSMDVAGIPVICRAASDDPVGNAVKDSMLAKVGPDTHNVLAVVYGSSKLKLASCPRTVDLADGPVVVVLVRKPGVPARTLDCLRCHMTFVQKSQYDPTMKLPDGPFPRGALPRALLAPLGMALLTAGCVSLDKPSALAACMSSGTCADHVADAGGYTAADLPVAADLRQGDEPPGARRDGIENRSSPPDVDLDRPDWASGGLDLAGPDGALDAPADESQRDSVASLDRALESGPDLLAHDVFASVGKDAVSDIAVGKDDVLRTDAVTRDTSFEVSTDQSVDSGSDCTIFYGSNMPAAEWGHPPAPNSTKGFCVVTCDEIDGWGCSNFAGRTVTVNGSPATCGSTKLVKKDGYFIFRVSPGSNISAAVYWWVFNPTIASNWATSCPAPAGGF